MTDLYISADIESDGPIPGEFAMLSFAHTHNALDDAVEQGEIFAHLFAWSGT